jgi:hypothetical protein
MLLTLGAALGLAACGGSSGGSPSTVTVTKSVSAPSTSTQTTGGSTQASTGARNLIATAAIKTQLLAAGAALHKLPATDYTGLTKGETYYAYDGATKTYWAGAQLIASKNSQQAQIGNQDDGAYLVFHRSGGGGWKGTETGASTTPSSCAVNVPAGVIAVWNWAPGACHPRTF